MTTPANGVAAGYQQPQTTVEPAGGPFIRHSQPGRRSMYQVSNLAFTSGNIITQPLVSVPGYYRGFRQQYQVSGGSGTATAATSADAPYNIASLVTLKDAFGTPVIVAPGYEAFNLIPMFGSQFGLGAARDPRNLPSYSPVNTGAGGTTGSFTFSTYLPFEFTKGYGVISGANSSLLPNLTVNIAASSTVYSTAPTTVGTLTVVNDADFYWLPEGVQVQPPGLGTTEQWVYQQANPGIGSAATTTVQFPRLGGYISSIIMEMRDSTGARIDAWPSRLRLYVDGVPLIDSSLNEIYDDMAIQYGAGLTYGITGTGTVGFARPTGVIAISRKTSLSQEDWGLFDTGETFLSTNPGTLIEIQGAPWGSVANAPATLNILVGQVVPSGNLIQGLPEV